MNTLLSEWAFARQLTTDLLDASSDSDLDYRLHATCGAFWKQFRHIARVHEAYLTALETGRISFEADGSYDGGASVDALRSHLEDLKRNHDRSFAVADPAATIDWFGEAIPVEIHLVRLLTHETLHHGQLMLYWRALGHPFPESWESWGEQ